MIANYIYNMIYYLLIGRIILTAAKEDFHYEYSTGMV